MGVPIQPWESARILQLRNQGLTWKTIAERLDRTIVTVQVVAKRHGYKKRAVSHYIRCPNGDVVNVETPNKFAQQYKINRGLFYDKQKCSNGFCKVSAKTLDNIDLIPLWQVES